MIVAETRACAALTRRTGIFAENCVWVTFPSLTLAGAILQILLSLGLDTV